MCTQFSPCRRRWPQSGRRRWACSSSGWGRWTRRTWSTGEHCPNFSCANLKWTATWVPPSDRNIDCGRKLHENRFQMPESYNNYFIIILLLYVFFPMWNVCTVICTCDWMCLCGQVNISPINVLWNNFTWGKKPSIKSLFLSLFLFISFILPITMPDKNGQSFS